MNPANDPLAGGLTPKDYDEYGDEPNTAPASAPVRSPSEDHHAPPNAGESPLG